MNEIIMKILVNRNKGWFGVLGDGKQRTPCHTLQDIQSLEGEKGKDVFEKHMKKTL
jgi:hypothetical protein